MSVARKVVVALLAFALTTTLATGAVVASAHLTVMDPDFVTQTIEEEAGYGVVEDAMLAAMGAEDDAAEGETQAAGPIDRQAVFADAVTESYLQSQTEKNVDRAYGYLHGNRDRPNLTVATTPIRENASQSVEDRIENATVAELVAASDTSLPGPMNASMLARMSANRSGYQEVRSEVRSQVRERVLDEAVDRAFEGSSNDELLRAVGEDPDEYSEAEKERFVTEHESEIRAALRDRIESERGDEIDRRVDERLAAASDGATGDAENDVEAAAASVQTVVVDGLTTDMSYESFSENLSAAKADLATASANGFERQLNESMPAQVPITQGPDGPLVQQLETARTAVQWFDRLSLLLPVFALGLVGLLYYVRQSLAAVASDVGMSAMAAGLPLLVGTEVAKSRVQSFAATAPEEAQATADLVVGLAGRALGTVADLAVVLLVGGLVLVGLSLAARYGYLAQARESLDV